MNYNMNARKVFKCDLCGGDPQCVRFCDEKAVDFITADVVSARKKRESATRQSEAQRQNPTAGDHA
jgi:Fe-S-cluster-containing hydrogenase component 2